MAMSAILVCVVGILVVNCGARVIPGPACDWTDTISCLWEVHSFASLIASGVMGNTQRSVLGSLYPIKISFP